RMRCPTAENPAPDMWPAVPPTKTTTQAFLLRSATANGAPSKPPMPYGTLWPESRMTWPEPKSVGNLPNLIGSSPRYDPTSGRDRDSAHQGQRVQECGPLSVYPPAE